MAASHTRTVSFALVAAGVWLTAAHPTLACSCMEPAPDTAYQRASQVFVGKVTQIDKPFLDRLRLTRSGLWHVHFVVSKRWKGSPSDSVTVRTRVTGESCGYPFRTGETYLVYTVANAEPVTGICTGTKDLAHADADLRALDALAGRSPRP
ncbi:MAG TPA: hypothetical protein VJ890_12715 [Vineibacter sp.]|nr:hypothetical protein [Vineibacter sp.]